VEEISNFIPKGMMDRSKKGQVSAGLVGGLVFGVASLIIGVIICFVIVSTLDGAKLMESGRTTTTVTNETNAWLNATAYPLSKIAANRQTYTLTAIWADDSGYTVVVPLANATVSAGGLVTLATAVEQANVSISYTYVTQSKEEFATEGAIGNFTAGVDNVSGKIPTVLLIAAIVLIMGMLALLIGVWQKMRTGGTGI
jgi:hypothetical protein